MTRQVNNQTPTLGPTHNLKHTQYESQSKSKRIIIKEWSCNLFKIFSLMRYAPLSTNCSKGGTHVTTHWGKNFHVDLKCAQKGRGPKLLAPITSNKNKQKSNKNLEVMTRAQLPRQEIKTMAFEEINLMAPLKMGRATY